MKALISAATIALILGSSGATALAQGRYPTGPGGPPPGPGYRAPYPPGYVVDRRFGRRPPPPPRRIYPPFVVAPEYRRVPPPPFFPLGGILRFAFR